MSSLLEVVLSSLHEPVTCGSQPFCTMVVVVNDYGFPSILRFSNRAYSAVKARCEKFVNTFQVNVQPIYNKKRRVRRRPVKHIAVIRLGFVTTKSFNDMAESYTCVGKRNINSSKPGLGRDSMRTTYSELSMSLCSRMFPKTAVTISVPPRHGSQSRLDAQSGRSRI